MYQKRDYSRVMWLIEQDCLTDCLQRMRKTHERIEHLDFACGTGRVLAFLEDKADTSTGIEISEQMAAIAQTKITSATIHCKDITPPDAEVEGTYDLITAFRFFLNAEPALRVAAINALRSRMRDESSRFFFNNHGNLFSHKILFWPLHRLRHGKNWRSEGNYMRHSEVKKLLHDAGFEIEWTRGCGMLSAKLARILPFGFTLAVERFLSKVPLLNRLGVDVMYVARLKNPQT